MLDPSQKKSGIGTERQLRLLLGFVALLIVPPIIALVVLATKFDGLTEPVALDHAQVARHVVAGNGFATNVLRPLSLTLNPKGLLHPDLYNAPAHPLLLAAVYLLSGATERPCAILGIGLWLVSVWLTFLVVMNWWGRVDLGIIAAALYGMNVAMLTAAVGGLPYPLATLCVLISFWALFPKNTGPEIEAGMLSSHRLTIAGLACGIAVLTDYLLLSFAIVMAVSVLFTQTAKWTALRRFMIALILVIGPWWCRNLLQHGGPWFGLFGYTAFANTSGFPGETIWRTTEIPSGLLVYLISHPFSVIRKIVLGFVQYRSSGASVIDPVVAFLMVIALFSVGNRGRWGKRLFAMIVGSLVLTVLVSFVFRADPRLLLVWSPLVAIIGAVQLVEWTTDKIGNFRIKASYIPFRHSSQDVTVPWPVTQTLVYLVEIIIAALPLAVYLLGKPLRPNEAAQGIYRSLGERLPTNAVILTDRPLEVAWYAKRRAVWLCQSESDLPVIEKATGPVTAVFVTPLIKELPIKEWGDWWSRIILPHGVYRGMWPSEAFGTQFIFRQRLDTSDTTGAASELDLLMREVANTPDSAEAHTQLAVAYLMREQLQEAVREFEEAIRLDDNNTQALLGLWQAKARISEPPETLSLSQLALQTTPNDANSVAVLERAIRYFNTLLQQNRDNPWLLLNVAMCQARLKNWEAVEAAYHGLSRLAPKTFPPDLLMVNLYLQQGLIQEAALGCERLIKSKVALPTAYQLLGSIYSSTGKLPEALEAFKKAIELRPQSSAAYQQAARVCFLLGRNADAAQLLLDALRVVPRSSAVRFDLAKIRLAENDTNKAILIYEDILRDYPDHPVALNNIAELLARSNKLKRALELAARATRVYPNNPAIQDTYGWILYLSDQPAEALKHLREAVRLAPAMGIAHYHLGKVLIANGQEQNGADALRVALAQGLPRIEEADADSIVKVH